MFHRWTGFTCSPGTGWPCGKGTNPAEAAWATVPASAERRRQTGVCSEARTVSGPTTLPKWFPASQPTSTAGSSPTRLLSIR